MGVLTLVGCAVAYVAFHAVRETPADGWFAAATPSFLLPLAMAATLDLHPRIRFRRPLARAIALGAATLVAAVWFEGVAPLVIASTHADWRDAAAMAAGGGLAATLGYFASPKQ